MKSTKYFLLHSMYQLIWSQRGGRQGREGDHPIISSVMYTIHSHSLSKRTIVKHHCNHPTYKHFHSSKFTIVMWFLIILKLKIIEVNSIVIQHRVIQSDLYVIYVVFLSLTKFICKNSN